MDELRMTGVALDGLEAELSRLVAGASWAGTEATLAQARVLLERARTAPAQAAAAEQEATGWRAMRSVEGAQPMDVVCWNEHEHAVVSGTWSAGAWRDVLVQVGAEVVASAATASGERWVSARPDALSPAEQRRDHDLDEKLSRAWKETAQSGIRPGAAPGEWTCRACGWANRDEERTCRMCLSPAGATEFRAGVPHPSAAHPAERIARRSGRPARLELPHDLVRLIEGFARAAAERKPVGTPPSAAADAEAAPVERRCPSCDRIAGPDARYCQYCGADLAEPPPAHA